MEEDRLKHSIGVGRKMVEIGKAQGLDDDELYDLFVLGYNHDIGYEFGNSENHAKVGGKILKNSKYKYWREVYYHGTINTEYESSYLDILNSADMQINHSGKDVGFDGRLKDIRERYGAQSNVYKNALILIKRLKNR
ncbi:HD domain-containing protein [Candidatus Saccharibacteria bacterium]|nr:HD domain-containing protein [Candidatus Saccharibacteria bacterium]